ncbi:MAG TPA: MEDS domain-containing protein [Jatrophihabitans sp.]|nr:MEDS domain-containing protein [Jatrophihabitans sp.]
MTAAPAVGLPHTEIEPGEHLCALYQGYEGRDEVLIPYLREGLAQGHKCLSAISQTDSTALESALQNGSDTAALLDSGQLEIHTAREPVIDPQEFGTTEVIAFWESHVVNALDAGFPFVRLSAEARWWMPQLPEIDDLVRHESELNRYAAKHAQSILCLYDLSHYGGRVLMDLLLVHPQVVVCGVPFDNPNYLSPDEFLAYRETAAAEVEAEFGYY